MSEDSKSSSDSIHNFGLRSKPPDPVLGHSCRTSVNKVVVDLIDGCTVVTIEEAHEARRATLINAIASALQERTVSVVRATGLSATPMRIQNLLASALYINAAEPRGAQELLWAMRADKRAHGIVLLLDDADMLSASVFRYLWLLIRLFEFETVKLRLVFVGETGGWIGLEHPDLEDLRQKARARSIIRPSTEDEAILSPNRELPRSLGQRNCKKNTSLTSSEPLISEVLVNFSRGFRLLKLPAKSRQIPWQLPITMLLALILSFAVWDLLVNNVSDAQANLASPFRVDDVPAMEQVPTSSPAVAMAREVLNTPVIPRTNRPFVNLAATAVPLPDKLNRASSPSMPSEQSTADPSVPELIHRGGPGLVLLAQAGDTMSTLYARVYRGLTPPPYSDVVAANRVPFRTGAIVVFPAPPQGWAKP